MEAVSYTCNGVVYRVEPITNIDVIDGDIATVLDTISDTSLELYKDNMIKAVQQEFAFAVYKDTIRVGFIYNYMDRYKYIGASVYIKDDIISAIIALRTMFEINTTHKLTFIPHKNGLRYFKSMATGQSIRAFHGTGSPLVVLRDDVYSKGLRMFKYLGIK